MADGILYAQGDTWQTRWSLILLKQSQDPAEAAQALEALLRQYRGLLIRYVARRVLPQDAEDIVQEFLVQVMNEKLLVRADREKGSFRALVRSALDDFLTDLERRGRSQKRNPEGKAIPLQLHAESLTPGVPKPDEIYDLCWFTDLVESSRRELWPVDSVEWTISEIILLRLPREQATIRHGLSSPQISEMIRQTRRVLRNRVQGQLRQLCSSREVYEQEWSNLSRFAKKASTPNLA